MHPLARLDREFVWHPFTQMQDWLRSEPRVIVSGKGALLRDAHGREYLDANASIWTNLHGHRHPHLNRALRRQLGQIAHSSALGLANEPASQLAAELIRAARHPAAKGPRPAKVFFSDDGSTALEVALKLAFEFARRTRGQKSPRFLSLRGAYHGDTIGAVSLGHIDLFHAAYDKLLFKTDAVMAPYCYRCPFNRADPSRADARLGRQCRWECVDKVESAFHRARRLKRPYAALVVEPRLQGAAGIIPQPDGWLRRVAAIARAHDTPIIADEVMTGFGRTGIGDPEFPRLFASHHEGVQPDFLCLAKGLSGGYLPLAATLTTQAVFDAFLGRYEDFKTFFHGHSFTGNQLGSAAALASLELLREPAGIARRAALEKELAVELQPLWTHPAVGDIRQVGLVAGIELVRDWRTREPFPLEQRVGIKVCEAMAQRGVLTRPVGNVIVLMPPYCTTRRQLHRMVQSLADALAETLPT
jgi:adenosylmethionine-8-amino-7-oxononanoate aminotransferase